METTNPYEQGHLLVAALRLFSFRHQRPPSVRELAEAIDLSPEMGHYLCNRLARLGVIEIVEAPFDDRVYLKDHLKLEELPREEKPSGLEAEIQGLLEEKQRRQEELQKIQHIHENKKKDLFSDLERQLKEGLKKRKNPLDEI